MAMNQLELTAPSLGQKTEEQLKQETVSKALANPNQLQTGPQTGMTPTNGMIAPTPLNFQAIYNSPQNQPISTTEKKDTNTLTSTPANNYLDKLRQEAADKEEYLRKQAAAAGSWMQRENTKEDMDAINYAKSTGMGMDEKVGIPTTFAGNVKKIKEELDPQKEQMLEAQKEAQATSKASQFYNQQSGTEYAKSATQKLQRKIDIQNEAFARKERDLVQGAWANALGGQIDMAEKLRGDAERSFQERLQVEELAMKEKDQVMKLQEYEDNRALQAQDRAMGTIGNLVKAGFTADQIPASYLEEMDASAGMPKGFSQQLFDVAQEEKQASTLQNQEEIKAKSIANAGKIVDIMKSLPKGESITIEGVEYSGLDVGNLKSGMEVDQNTGQATAWSFNPETGEVVTTPMGNIGTKKDGFETVTLGDGSIWRINPQTGQSQPFYASQAQTTWNAALPEGETGPVLPGNPAAAGQCGALCNWAYGTRILPNKFGEKQVAMKKYEVSKEDVQVGDTFLMSAGDTGHVGIVNGVDYGPDGKVILKFTESNYVPPGGGKMSHSRTMSIDDPKLKMFARIPIPNLPLAGTDSEFTQVASGGAPPSILGAGTKTKAQKDDDLDSPLSPSEAQSLGVKYGTTKRQAMEKGIVPGNKIGVNGQSLRNLESGQVKLISEGKQTAIVLDPLDKIINENEDLFGPIAGKTIAKNPYGKAAALQDDFKRAAQVVGAFMEGGVLRKEDEEKYASMLPNFTDRPEVARNKLKGVREMLEARRNQYIQDAKAAGYDVSQFESGKIPTQSTQSQEPKTSQKIKVKRKSNGQMYMIDESKFNPSIFEKVK